MRAMKVCTYTNLGAASALFLVLGFAACAGNKPAPPATPADAPAATDDSAAGNDSTAPDEGAGDSAGGGMGKTPEPGKGNTKETRTTEVIAQIIKDHRKPFRACYDKAHKQLPNLKGNMTLHFVLDPAGKVKSAELNIERSDIKAPLAVDCAIKELKKLEFPASSRGMQSEVNYPFNFKPH
jgi:hypothetical protein